MADILDSKFVDVKFEGGKLVAEVPVKEILLVALKPLLEKLKEKIPGTIDDAFIDKLVKEIEEL